MNGTLRYKCAWCDLYGLRYVPSLTWGRGVYKGSLEPKVEEVVSSYALTP